MSRQTANFSDSVRDQAIAWLVRVESDAATADDWMALEAWLAQSPAHRDAFDEIEVLGSALADEREAVLEGLESDAADPGVVDLTARRAKRLAPDRRAWIGAAAAAVLAVAVGVGVLGQPRTQLYETSRGEVRTVRLEDGSTLRLNGASTVRVRFERGARRVYMDGAEAAFDVAHDSRRPFVIEAADRRIQVLGTAFNVRDDDRTVTVTVSRGVVVVGPLKGPAQARLTAGRELVHRVGGASTVRPAEPNSAFAWTSGRLVCRDRRLADIVADLNRRLPTPVTVEGPAANLRFTGVLVVDDETAVLRALEAYLPVRATRGTDRIRITSR